MQSLEYSQIKNLIAQAVDPRKEGIKLPNTRHFAHEIIGGLWLGNDEKFVEVTELQCRTKKGVPLDTSNPHKFKSIISVCSFSRVVREMPDLNNYTVATVKENFEVRKIQWIQMGCSLPDDKHAWTDLVYNATFPDTELAQVEHDIPRNSQDPKHAEFRAKKKEVVEKLPVDQWFSGAFTIFDQAVAGKRTLVHCHAGVSRSAALLTAYLINRYDVNEEQAIAFLRSKRACVKPKCIADLKAYAIALQTLRQGY